MTTATAPYVYTSLDSDQEDSFRLLNLLPGVGNSLVKCTLTHTTRSAPFQQYEALSYAWGHPSLTCEIVVNGLLLPITRNLEQALRSLRHDSSVRASARILWVDAVCINQSCISERNHQVSQMHEIYAGAETVVIWLGDASADSDVAIAFMWEVYQRLASKGQFSGDSVRSGQYLEADFQDGIVGRRTRSNSPSRISALLVWHLPTVAQLDGVRYSRCWCLLFFILCSYNSIILVVWLLA
jgi:hypothetical protein